MRISKFAFVRSQLEGLSRKIESKGKGEGVTGR